MKDWEWFALGLVPFGAMPTHVIRWMIEDHVPSPGVALAGAAAGQGVAWTIQKAGMGRLNQALLIHRAAQLGLVEEGLVAGTGHSLYTGKKVTGVRYGPLRGSGIGFKPTLAMRGLGWASVITAIGGIAHMISPISSRPNVDRHSHQNVFGPDMEQYI